MTAAIRTELVKLWRRPALRWLVIAAAVMAALFGYLIPYLVGTDGVEGGGPGGEEQGFAIPVEELFPANLVENAISGFPLFYLAIALVLGALSAGSEYGWGTIRTLLVQGPGRLSILAGKLVALVLASSLIVVAAFGASAASSVVIALIEGGALDPPGIAELLRGIGAAWLILAVGGALGLAGGVIARGTGAVIGAGLVYLFVVELLLQTFAARSAVIEAIAEALPGVAAGSVAGALTEAAEGAPGVNALISGTRGVLTLVAWFVVSVVVAAVVFDRRDVTA